MKDKPIKFTRISEATVVAFFQSGKMLIVSNYQWCGNIEPSFLSVQLWMEAAEITAEEFEKELLKAETVIKKQVRDYKKISHGNSI